MLISILNRDIPIENVVADRVFETSSEAAEVIKLLSKAAADLGHTEVIARLGQTEAIGAHYEDILADIPEVMPVMRVKVSFLDSKQSF